MAEESTCPHLGCSHSHSPGLGHSQDPLLEHVDQLSPSADDADRYVRNCRKYGMPVDPSIVITLRTRWHLMQPTKSFCEGGMLPLFGILEFNNHIKTLNLSGAGMHTRRGLGNGNSNARVLNQILAKNDTIDNLVLSDTGLDDDGITEICEVLKKNSTITTIDLSRNQFGSLGAERLRLALMENKSVQCLDLSSNMLGFQSIHALQCSCTRIHMKIDGNYVFEEILNSVSHGVGFLLSVVGAILLMSEAAELHTTDYHFWACLLFSFSLMFLFMSSTLYHSFFMMPKAFRILQILDHVGIYMLIAGSYTPFMLIGLHSFTSARILLIFEWLVALSGAVFSACSDLNSPVTNTIELSLFLAMGLGCFIVWPAIATMPQPAVILLMAGGAAYLTGILFFVWGNYKPIFHVVWHLFVMLGAALHWFDVYFFIVGTSLEPQASVQ